MKTFVTLFSGAIAVCSSAFASPAIASNNAESLVNAMTAAHGDIEKWMAAPSHEFTIAMYLNSLPLADNRTPFDNWRYYTVQVDPRTSTTLVDVSWEDADGPELAITSDRIWRRPMSYDPSFREPPMMLAWYHFGMIYLPFLIQSDEVRLSLTDGIEHPYTGESLLGVKAEFSPANGKVHEGSITLYIDPDTKRLAAWRLGTMFPPLPGDILPSPVPTPGATPLRVVEEYAEYDGFLLPRAYSTLMPDGNVAGTHVLLQASSNKKLDGKILTPPEDAEIIFERGE